jgi:hypothetical protein
MTAKGLALVKAMGTDSMQTLAQQRAGNCTCLFLPPLSQFANDETLICIYLRQRLYLRSLP